MAQEMDDLEFLLPSELLTDDDLLTDFGCGFGNSSGLSSDLCSPVESVTGSTETGSDEDDFVSELTRKLTHSTLRDSGSSYDHAAKGLKLSGSPQSTLCGFKLGSRGSPNSDSRICSPLEAKDALSWDLLYAAAEEVARMRMVEETAAFYSSKPIGPAHKPTPVSVPQQKLNPPPGFYSNQAQTQTHISYQQLQAAKYKQMMEQGKMEYLLQKGRDGGGDRAYGLSMSAWPTLQQSNQQQTGSGIKLGFVGETGPKKERVGTGVFMPRRFGPNPTETRKKPVSQALSMDSMDAQVDYRGVRNLTPDYDAISKHRINIMMSNQRRNQRAQPLVNQEFRLPQEWTY